MADIQAIEHIEMKKGLSGTRPYIRGRRIAVEMIVILYEYQGASIEEIVEGWDLTPGQIYAALSYYHDHKENMDRQIAEGRQKSEERFEMSDIQKRLMKKLKGRGDE